MLGENVCERDGLIRKSRIEVIRIKLFIQMGFGQ
jgi:hypothetical protein